MLLPASYHTVDLKVGRDSRWMASTTICGITRSPDRGYSAQNNPPVCLSGGACYGAFSVLWFFGLNSRNRHVRLRNTRQGRRCRSSLFLIPCGARRRGRVSLDSYRNKYGAARNGQERAHQRPGKMASGARWTDCVIAGKLRRGQQYARLAHGWYFGEAHLSVNVFRGHRCLRVDRMARDEESAEEFRSYETIESVSAQSSGR